MGTSGLLYVTRETAKLKRTWDLSLIRHVRAMRSTLQEREMASLSVGCA
jgi:hypothetical protein